MIATARSKSDDIRFEVSTAEELGANLDPPIQDGSIDLITAANAAHWFDMSSFWPAAAYVLRPGGSVAIWTSGRIYAHPDMPNAAAIQEAIDRNREQHLEDYREPGNVIVQNSYRDLLMPWDMEPPVPEFGQSGFWRKDWPAGEPFYVGEGEMDLDRFEKVMGSGSSVTRWRQAHPDAAGTEQDVVRMLRRDMERLLHEAGVEKGEETLRGAMQGVVLMFKKSG